MEPVNVVATDIRHAAGPASKGPFAYCDVTDKESIARLVVEHRITHIMHLATLLSAVGERNPQLALRVNNMGIQNVLEVAATHNVSVSLPLSPPFYVALYCASWNLGLHGVSLHLESRKQSTAALMQLHMQAHQPKDSLCCQWLPSKYL